MPQSLNRTLFISDNLPVLRGIDSESIDLIATDPPFNKGVKAFEGITSAGENVSYSDVWTWGDVQAEWVKEIDEDHPALSSVIRAANSAAGDDMGAFLCWLGVRVLEMHRVLKPTGSLYLHCDPTASHYLKAVMDAVFEARNFRNEISWKRTTTKGDYRQGATNWPRVRDIILCYGKNVRQSQYYQQFAPYSDEYINRSYRHIEKETGRRYRLDNLAAPGGGTRGHPQYTFLGVTRFWRYNEGEDAGIV